tara:strand:- start:335 stop:1408 length:1074 start_codon:yes stop_codon:yes gene_type:complete
MQQKFKNNTTLIIPAAGSSSRYPGVRPKWMLTHPDGKLMIEKVLLGFDYKKYKKTYVVVLKEHCDAHEADIVLNQAFGQSIEVVVLEEKTNSCPETIFKTIKKCEIKGQIIIKDTDCIVKFENNSNKNFISGMEINSDSKVKSIQNKSFIVKNDNNIIQDIVEKSIVSNNICLGVYSCNAADFILAYNSILDSNVMFETKELYISHIISYLIISKGVIFEYVEAKKYIDWGTISEWQDEREKYKTYIFDIDGVMLKNYGKYGTKNWENTFEPILENVDLVKELSQNNEIIFMTSRPEKYILKFKEYLNKEKIKYKTIITGCNHSKRIIVNDFALTNPYPSCSSISVKRNSILKNYMK